MESLCVLVILLGLVTKVGCNCVVIRSNEESEWNRLTSTQPPGSCFQASGLSLVGLDQELCGSSSHITTIDVSNNSFRNVEDIKCFGKIQHLNLSRNYIESLHNGDFGNFPELKTVDLSWNRIKHISPEAFPWKDLRKMESINLAYNKLTELDSWYLMLNNNTFRYFNVSHNIIERFSNSYKWHITTSMRSCEKQPQLCLDLSYNNVSQINYDTISSFKIQDLFADIFRTMSQTYIFDIYATFGNSIQTLFVSHKWKCDCDMYLFYWLFWDALRRYQGPTDPSYIFLLKSECKRVFETSLCHNSVQCQASELNCIFYYLALIICDNTLEQFEGKPLISLKDSKLYGTCTMRQNCPGNCSCVKDYTNTSITSVNCTGRHLTDLPHQMPSGVLKLYMDKNYIKELTQRTYYWKRVIVLDVSFNYISQMSHSVFEDMVNLEEMYLHNNKLKEINKEIREVLKKRNLEEKTLNIFQIHKNPLQCDCSLKKWLTELKFQDKYMKVGDDYFTNVTCVFNGLHNLMAYNCDLDVKGIIIGATCSVVIVAILLIVGYRYRQPITLVLYNRLGVNFGHMLEKVLESEIYDAFVFYHSDVDEQRMFVTEELCTYLENSESHYKLLIPDRDFELGISFQENLNEAIKKSRRCILIVSRQFVKSKTCMGVFQLAHEKNCARKGLYLVVVKYKKIYRNDYVDSALLVESDVLYSQYMRLGCFIDVASKKFAGKLKYLMPGPKMRE